MTLPRVGLEPVMMQTRDILFPKRTRKLARSAARVKRFFTHNRGIWTSFGRDGQR